MDNPKILVHVCCAVCGAALTDFLKDKYEVVLFFYNPNIHPEEEYKKRKESVEKLAKIYGITFIEGEYDKENWFLKVKGLETEPEGGKRCPVCFEMRLEKTARLAKERGIKFFSTTLSMSPYKNEEAVGQIADEIAKQMGLEFLDSGKLGLDKKQNWQKSRQLAREYNFYHQKYCGCQFSIRK